MFPLEKYKYYVDEKNRTVVAVQTFAKKAYRGIARCSEKDTFDVEKGKKLAALKCNLKIANERMKFAQKRMDIIFDLYCAFEGAKKETNDYWTYACETVDEANRELIKFVDEEL